MPRRSPPLAQPSLFDAGRVAPRASSPPVPMLSADDRIALHVLFHNGTSTAIDRFRILTRLDGQSIDHAIAAGFVVEVPGGFRLTPSGVEMMAREEARSRAESRHEEEAIGAAMRHHAARESGREYAQRPAPAPAPRTAAGTPTDLNLWVLSELFGGASSVPNRTQAPSIPHLRRCLKAGLITATKERLTLTPAGVAALAGFRARQPGAKPNARPMSAADARASFARHRKVVGVDPRVVRQLFERQREAFAALFPAVSRARLHIVRRTCPHAMAPCAGRDLAWMVDGDVHLLARALDRGPNVVGALLAHELGHAADASRHLPGSEQRADDLAAVILGKPIRYTAADAVQTFGAGAWPRPLHLHR